MVDVPSRTKLSCVSSDFNSPLCPAHVTLHTYLPSFRGIQGCIGVRIGILGIQGYKGIYRGILGIGEYLSKYLII